MKISVVIIAYNIENLIEKCLDSVLNQSFKDYEVIVVNDGSTDGTLRRINKYQSDGVMIVDQANGGIVSARQAGVKASTGDYIVFVDGDDTINQDMLWNMYQLVGETGADIGQTRGYTIDEKGLVEVGLTKIGNKCFTGWDYFESIMLDRIDHYMFPKIYKRSFLIEAGYLYYPQVSMAEDLLTNALLGCFEPQVVFGDTVNYYYSFNGNSIIRKGGKGILEQIGTMVALERFLEAKGLVKRYHEHIDYQWFSFTVIYVTSSFSHISPKIKYEIIRRCKDKIVGYNDNRYCMELLKNIGSKAKVQYLLYYNNSCIAPIYDAFRSIAHNFIQKNKLGKDGL